MNHVMNLNVEKESKYWDLSGLKTLGVKDIIITLDYNIRKDEYSIESVELDFGADQEAMNMDLPVDALEAIENNEAIFGFYLNEWIWDNLSESLSWEGIDPEDPRSVHFWSA